MMYAGMGARVSDGFLGRGVYSPDEDIGISGAGLSAAQWRAMRQVVREEQRRQNDQVRSWAVTVVDHDTSGDDGDR